jgi:hypothetical protein
VSSLRFARVLVYSGIYHIAAYHRHSLTCPVHSDVGCKTVANMIKGKTPEEIRKLFNIVNDFTPEEEAQIKKENVRYASDLCRLLSLFYFVLSNTSQFTGMG